MLSRLKLDIGLKVVSMIGEYGLHWESVVVP